jgi:hypothetical protein
MGRKSRQTFQEIAFDAKKILNENNIHPYSDDEIKEIIKFLESFANIFCDCILSKMK